MSLYTIVDHNFAWRACVQVFVSNFILAKQYTRLGSFHGASSTDDESQQYMQVVPSFL